MDRRANIESIPGLPRSPLLGKLTAYFLDCFTSLCGGRVFHSSSSDVLQGLILLNWDGGRVAFHCAVPCTVCPRLIFFSWNHSFQELSTDAYLPDLSLCQGAEQLVGLSRLYKGCRVPQHWSLNFRFCSHYCLAYGGFPAMNTNHFQPTSIRTIISNGHYLHGTWNLDMKIDLTSTRKAMKHSELTWMFARYEVKAMKCQIEVQWTLRKWPICARWGFLGRERTEFSLKDRTSLGV